MKKIETHPSPEKLLRQVTEEAAGSGRRHVAEIDRQGLVPDIGGGKITTTEVNVFDEHVAGDGQRAARPQHGAIVAPPHQQIGVEHRKMLGQQGKNIVFTAGGSHCAKLSFLFVFIKNNRNFYPGANEGDLEGAPKSAQRSGPPGRSGRPATRGTSEGGDTPSGGS